MMVSSVGRGCRLIVGIESRGDRCFRNPADALSDVLRSLIKAAGCKALGAGLARHIFYNLFCGAFGRIKAARRGIARPALGGFAGLAHQIVLNLAAG
jgi:hypothetical protein